MSMTSPTKFYHVTQIIVDVFMWPKFGNFCIYLREVIITSTLRGFDQKKHFFEGWSWLKFNNLEQALSMALKLYTNQKFLWIILTFVEVTGGKLVGWPFRPSPHLFWIGLSLSEGQNVDFIYRKRDGKVET